jgi:hypothetical protein
MNHLKGGLKVLTGYLISLVVFIIFLYPFIGITKDNFYKWLPVYSIIFFLLMLVLIYTDIRKLAAKEKRPQYDLNPYPFKGFILGLIGFSPIILIELIYPLIVLDSETLVRIKHLALNTILGPLYFIIRFAGGTAAAYVIASLIVPLIAMLAYLAGYYGLGADKSLKASLNDRNASSTQEFKKSPWNPSTNENRDKVKKSKN